MTSFKLGQYSSRKVTVKHFSTFEEIYTFSYNKLSFIKFNNISNGNGKPSFVSLFHIFYYGFVLVMNGGMKTKNLRTFL